ncbi:MAG: hypothetical protein LBM08_09730 [Dysgonamonadaceae bacterium]|jgi:hypothetical protein|nr:hypothetical protein [Dysgonamonadaceae bacterium]
MEVLILSKTRMNGGKCCVGGIASDGNYVRLLTSWGENQPGDTDLDISQIWEIDYTDRPYKMPPHVEDVLVQTKQFVGKLSTETSVGRHIQQLGVQIWEGHPNVLFDAQIKWTNSGSGYINEEAIPTHSVGFWISDRNLFRQDYYGKLRYTYPAQYQKIPYVGYQQPINNIPAGTLLRVSLARWWQQDERTEQRCYLQLSGWYQLGYLLIVICWNFYS